MVSLAKTRFDTDAPLRGMPGADCDVHRRPAQQLPACRPGRVLHVAETGSRTRHFAMSGESPSTGESSVLDDRNSTKKVLFLS